MKKVFGGEGVERMSDNLLKMTKDLWDEGFKTGSAGAFDEGFLTGLERGQAEGRAEARRALEEDVECPECASMRSNPFNGPICRRCEGTGKVSFHERPQNELPSL